MPRLDGANAPLPYRVRWRTHAAPAFPKLAGIAIDDRDRPHAYARVGSAECRREAEAALAFAERIDAAREQILRDAERWLLLADHLDFVEIGLAAYRRRLSPGECGLADAVAVGSVFEWPDHNVKALLPDVIYEIYPARAGVTRRSCGVSALQRPLPGAEDLGAVQARKMWPRRETRRSWPF